MQKAINEALDCVPRRLLWPIYEKYMNGKVVSSEEYFRCLQDIGSFVSTYVGETFDRPNYSDPECEFFNKCKE